VDQYWRGDAGLGNGVWVPPAEISRLKAREELRRIEALRAAAAAAPFESNRTVPAGTTPQAKKKRKKKRKRLRVTVDMEW
jgi:hypothetical protein